MRPVERTPRRSAPARIPFRAPGPTVRHRRVRSSGNDADAAEPDGLAPELKRWSVVSTWGVAGDLP